jgi:hypothetical protein
VVSIIIVETRNVNGKMIHSVIDYIGNTVVRKTSICEDPYSMEFMEALINRFIMSHHDLVVPVFNYVKIKKLVYTYDMSRLNSLSKEEEKLVDLISDIEIKTNKPYDKIIPYLDDRHPIARDKFPGLVSFIETVYLENRYHDIHGGNVMIDHLGNYKLIDLEGFNSPPLSDIDNLWITS